MSEGWVELTYNCDFHPDKGMSTMRQFLGYVTDKGVNWLSPELTTRIEQAPTDFWPVHQICLRKVDLEEATNAKRSQFQQGTDVLPRGERR